ncbi:hypothetical protein T02_14100 [Trichinella nativa]|uniref:Uncharacterized protein n=1 Tax=Trichinella nativa TaxID=6335 RepID=A0A0V1LLG2_9BILA|nr:hypothetical protein T02_14100 [Trichinella nativa]
MRYSLKLTSFLQYFVVLGKSIFLHFRSISNKLKKVVSIRVEMCIKSSISHLHKRDFIMMYWAKIQSNCDMLGIKEMLNE